jgi:hypothetical protein
MASARVTTVSAGLAHWEAMWLTPWQRKQREIAGRFGVLVDGGEERAVIMAVGGEAGRGGDVRTAGRECRAELCLAQHSDGVSESDDCVGGVGALGGDVANALATEAAREIALRDLCRRDGCSGGGVRWRGRGEATARSASEEGGLVLLDGEKSAISRAATASTMDGTLLELEASKRLHDLEHHWDGAGGGKPTGGRELEHPVGLGGGQLDHGGVRPGGSDSGLEAVEQLLHDLGLAVAASDGAQAV